MNILFLAPFPIVPYEGGVQRVTDTLSKEFLELGHSVNYLCYGHINASDEIDFLCKQSYIELDCRTDIEIRDELEQYVTQNKITHVINQVCDAQSNRIISLLPPSLRDKIVFTYHIIPFNYLNITRKRIWDIPTHNFRQLLFKIVSLICPFVYRKFFLKQEKRDLLKGIRLVSKCCLISKKHEENILRVIPDFPKEKIVAINNPNTYSIQSDLPVFHAREKAILWVGRIASGQKNLIGFIRMWSIFSRQHPDWKAYVVGDGPDFHYFKSYIIKNNIRRLQMIGSQKDVMSFYKKCRFLAVTSFGESWGMILTEAMTCGCIPIAMNTFATLTDIIDDGINGVICEPNDVNMANKLEGIVNNLDECICLSNNAILKAKNFEAEVVSHQWISLLESL